MSRSAPLQLLLCLYPAGFRERFRSEIQEYLTMRQAEVAQRGPFAVAWLTANLAAELTGSALKERTRALSADNVSVYCVALTLGFAIGTTLLAVSLLTFEGLVRRPLHQMAKGGADGAAGVALAGTMVVAVLGLAAVYRRARRPHAIPPA